MLKLLFTLLTGILLSLRALAWNAEGHMVVAQIAYNHLDPVAKARCDALIAVPLTYASAGTSNFITASVWADEFRTQLGTANWHYINLPFSLDGTPTNGVGGASFDVVRAIDLAITNLQNPALSVSNQAVSLRYLLHFVGDVHQPLHCVAAVWASRPTGDAGGNLFNLLGTWSNLHSLWDEGGGFLTDGITGPLSASERTTLSNIVAGIELNHPYAPSPAGLTNGMSWAVEGLNVSQTVCYTGITTNTTPSSNYLASAELTTEERMAKAGHRLADLLNTLFPANPIVLSALTTTNGTLSFSWDASLGTMYRVQTKTNLTDATWGELTSITATNNLISFSEPLTSGRRFYRVTR